MFMRSNEIGNVPNSELVDKKPAIIKVKLEGE